MTSSSAFLLQSLCFVGDSTVKMKCPRITRILKVLTKCVLKTFRGALRT